MSNEYNRICEEVRELIRSGGSSNITQAWAFLLLQELRHLNENIEALLSKEKMDKRTGIQRRVESTLGKSIAELLSERQGKSIREIATELGISKSAVAQWKKELDL